ncbi:putative Proteasome subunit [Leishmania shawi]
MLASSHLPLCSPPSPPRAAVALHFFCLFFFSLHLRARLRCQRHRRRLVSTTTLYCRPARSQAHPVHSSSLPHLVFIHPLSLSHHAIMIEDHAEYGHNYYPKKLANTVLTLPQQGAKQQQWSPYQDNGGTTAAIAGNDFVLLAGDTRLNGNFCLHTRHDESKIFQLTPHTYMASNGMQADRLQLQQLLKYRIKWYRYNNGGKVPSTKSIAQLLSTVLYHRRFFPYYTFNMIVGLNEEGHGVCYSYDAVGSTEPLLYGTRGSAASFVEPLLDCLINRQHMTCQAPSEMSKEEALVMLKNAFTGAAERDIYTGDSVSFITITKDSVQQESFALRKD